MKKIGIIGSTGSVGTSAISVVKINNKSLHIDFIVVQNSYKQAVTQALEFNIPNIYIENTNIESEVLDYLKQISVKLNVFFGQDAILNIIKEKSYDVLLICSSGTDTIKYYDVALETGKIIGMANKESIICAGELFNKKASLYNTTVIPIDSEHNSLYQIINKYNQGITKVLLTASGGPFIDFSEAQLKKVTKKEALTHPIWSMGNKITIDSATLMNKALEVIEASYLFDLDPSQIEVLIHRQSIVHGGVYLNDGGVFLHCSNPSMELPIAFVLGNPLRYNTSLNPISLQQLNSLTFEEVKKEKAKPIIWAKEALVQGGNMPCALNIINEVVVSYFLQDKIDFIDILRIIEDILQKIEYKKLYTIDDVLLEHQKIKNIATTYILNNY